jgi:hypothetical protein
MAFLMDSLTKGDLVARSVTEGVLRLDVGQEDVTLCVVEFCQDANYLSRERAIQNPTCFVAISSRDFDDRFLQEEWVVRVALADLICGKTDLCALIRDTAAQGRPRGVATASTPVCGGGPSGVFVESGQRATSDRRFIVEVGDGVVRIEGMQVIAEQAGPRFILFRTLWQWFLDDLRDGTAPNAFRAWPLEKLIEELESQIGKKYSDETTVRRVINNMQADFEQKLRRQRGSAIGREDIVETCPGGYRINPFSVAARAFQSNLS